MTTTQAASLVVLQQIKLELPKEAPQVITNLFDKCMQYDKSQRPEFLEVCTMFD